MVTSDLLTVVGLAVVVGILVEVIKRAWQPPEETIKRFGPLLALLVALAVGVPAAVYLSANPVQAVLTAVLAGASASGLYDSASSALSRTVPKNVTPFH